MGKPNANDKSVSKPAKTGQKKQTLLTNISSFPTDSEINQSYSNSNLILKKSFKSIRSVGLFDFLKGLGFPLEISRHYFHEVHIFNKCTQEEQKTIGFPTIDDGFEIMNPFFQGSVGERNISFIRGTVPKPDVIHIFVDSLDFLTFLSKIGGIKISTDVIILHSYSFLENIRPYIHEYGYKKIYTWMENDKTGAEAREFISGIIKKEEGLKHKSMNNLYKPYKNLHAWYKQRICKE